MCFQERDFKFCFTWYLTDITLCLWSGFIYPRIRTFDRKTFSRSLFQKEAFEISFLQNRPWVEAEITYLRRGKLFRRDHLDYLDYLKNEPKSGNMAVLEIGFRNIFLGKSSKTDLLPPSSPEVGRWQESPRHRLVPPWPLVSEGAFYYNVTFIWRGINLFFWS